MKLLVIDDEPLVAQVIAEALESEGNQVVWLEAARKGFR